jgi:hypothetical protein
MANFFKEYSAYLRDNPKGYWFRAKWFGWGWVPATWQGWLITALYILVVISFSMTIDEGSPTRELMFTFVLPLVLATASFIHIAYRTGEKPQWNWGRPKDKK